MPEKFDTWDVTVSFTLFGRPRHVTGKVQFTCTDKGIEIHGFYVDGVEVGVLIGEEQREALATHIHQTLEEGEVSWQIKEMKQA